jgi:hypothetical protein
MSFNNKANRPDSRDTAALRKEYEAKAQQMRETREPASRAKLFDDKDKAWQRVVAQQVGERKESLSEVQKSLAKIGQFKTDAQMAEARAKAEAERRSRRERER